MTRSIVSQAHDFYDAVPYEVPVPDTSLYELLDTAARLYPDRVALDYFGATTTYAQVRDQVLRAARVLHEAGVRAGDTVAISLPNCPQAFVAFYACMRIGAVAAQHNPLAPAAEIAGQLERHGGQVAIVWEKCVESFPPGSSQHGVHGRHFARHARLAAFPPEPAGASRPPDARATARPRAQGCHLLGPRHGLVKPHRRRPPAALTR